MNVTGLAGQWLFDNQRLNVDDGCFQLVNLSPRAYQKAEVLWEETQTDCRWSEEMTTGVGIFGSRKTLLVSVGQNNGRSLEKREWVDVHPEPSPVRFL